MRIVIAALVLVTAGSVLAEVPDSYIDTLIAQREQSKEIEQKESQKELARLQRALGAQQKLTIDTPAQKVKVGQGIKKTNERIMNLRKAMKASEAKDYLAIPPLTRRLTVGSIGRMRTGQIKVTQVLNKNSAICSWPGEMYYAVEPDRSYTPQEGKATPFILITDTNGWHDDQEIELDGVYASVDPKSFTTVIGSKRTLPVVEEIDENRIKDKWKEFNKKK